MKSLLELYIVIFIMLYMFVCLFVVNKVVFVYMFITCQRINLSTEVNCTISPLIAGLLLLIVLIRKDKCPCTIAS